MRTARPLGLSPDGRNLIVVIDGGEQVAIPADERLRAALRNDRARMGQLEIDMESALRPRDIQARIRAGESLEAVAQAAGVPPEKIEPFAGPVLAEREHIAGLAQTNPVRRAGDAVAHRSLRAVVTDRLLSRGVDADTVEWDAWRTEDRRWTVRLSYESGAAQRQADFNYDQTGRFSTAANDDARWLTGEQTSSHGPQPGRKRRPVDDSDDLGFDDELAIVRAIQPQFAVTPDVDDDLDDLDENDDDGTDSDDAYAEGDLAEVDGVYDIVPGDRSNLDVLYDMLSSFDEDSVQIYAGLVRPRPEQAATPMLDEGPPSADEEDDDGPTEPTQRLEADEQPTSGAPAAAGGEGTDVSDADAAVSELRVTDADVEDFEVASASVAPLDADADEAGEGDAEAPEVAEASEDGSDLPQASEDELPEDHPAAIDAQLARDEPIAVEAVAEEVADETTPVGDPTEPALVESEPAVSEPVVAESAASEPAVSEPVEVALIELDPPADPDEADPVADAPTTPADDAVTAEDASSEESVAAGQEQAKPTRPTGRKKAEITEPEQPSLVDEAGNEPSRSIKRKRASVPSWDEIMFGSPKPKE